MKHHLDRLNQPQQLAVKTTEGKVLILAGAGTGKTSVLTTRMAYLIEERKIPPQAILGLTFTNKAAEEMRERLAGMIGKEKSKAVTLCTFHSFCVKILRQEIHHLGYTKEFTIYQPSDVERLVKTIARDMLDRDGELPSLTTTLQMIADARNKGLKPEELGGSGTWHDGFTKDLFKKLTDSMRAHNAVDFDTMLCLTVELFERFPEVLERFQRRFGYVMIDEFQDTNPIQYKIAGYISALSGNLCVVGDDDQSIYGWRGADIRNILDFEGATVIKLEQNYRSTPVILQAANALIKHNSSRHDKVLKTALVKGDPIKIFHAPSEKDEAEAVVYRIAKMKKELGLKWKDFAILYRSNALSRHFEQILLKTGWQDGAEYKRGIPYEIFGGTEFFERREVKDLFAYLRVIVNPRDQMSLLRIINVPRRGIGDATLDALTAYNREANIPLWDVLVERMDTNTKLKEFVELIEAAKLHFANSPLPEAMKWLIERVNYKQAIKEEVKSQKMREFKWENVQELVSSMAEFEGNDLAEYVEATALDHKNEHMGQDRQNSDKVQLMTFHSAKGLEFPVCFLVGIEDNIIPHERSIRESGIEEERRLMYVAITRAKEKLHISMSQKRSRMGVEMPSKPSRFLYEIPKELLAITKYDSPN